MKKNTLKTILTGLLALIVCFGNAAMAFAVPSNGNEVTPAAAAVKKVLTMSDGTVTPAATFTFDLVAKSVDGSTVSSDLATMPSIASPSITFSAADTGTTQGGEKTVTAESNNIFQGVTFPHAGVYIYTLTEQSGTYTTANGETMTYSGGSYDIEVYVENGTSAPFISAVNAIVTAADNASHSVGEKVTPTPGSSTLVFHSQYQKMSGGTNPLTDSALTISKTVSGNYADKTKYFDFTANFTKALLETGTPTYKLYLYKGNTIQTTIPAVALVSGGTIQNDGTYDYIEAAAGTALTVKLMHEQKLSVLAAAVGTSYTVSEAGVIDYTPSVSVTTNGIPVTQNGTVNTTLNTGTQLITAGSDSADFTNTYKTINLPTGITMNNLPFLVLLLLAIGSFIIFVVAKSRKYRKTNR